MKNAQGKLSYFFIYITTIAYLFLLNYNQNNFKFALIVSVIYMFVSWLAIKNLLFAVFNVIFCSNLFLSVGKYQSIQILSSNDVTTLLFKGIYGVRSVIDYQYYKDGIFVFIGISMSILFSIFACLLLAQKAIMAVAINKKIIYEKLSQLNTFSLLVYLLIFMLVVYLTITSTKNSFVPLYSYTLISRIAVGGFIALLVPYVLKKSNDKYLFRSVILAITTVLVIFGFQQLLSFKQPAVSETASFVQEKQSFIIRPYGIFGHANPFSFVLAILLLFQLSQSNKNRLEKLSIVGLLLLIVFAQTRSVWLGIIVISILFYNQRLSVFIDFFRQDRFSVVRKFVFIIVVAVIGQRLIRTSFTLNYDGGLVLRSQMISDALKVYVDKPLFGNGLGSDILATLHADPESNMRFYPFSVHSGLVQFILEGGVVGLSLLMIVPIIVMLHSVVGKKSKAEKKVIRLTLSVFIIAFCYYMFQPSNFDRIEFGLFGLILGWYIASIEMRMPYETKNKT